MADKKYWEKRQEQKYLAGEKKINLYYAELKKSFEQSKKEIEKVINDFVLRYGIENDSPSYATALRKLNKTEIGDLQAFIYKAYAHMGEYDQELNNMSIKARITRYQALQKQIDATLQQLYADYQYKGEELLKEVYSDSYYQTWYNIDQYKGFHAEFAQINASTVEELIKYPFNGADFSSRLWKQKADMLQKMNESITTMLIQGRNPMTLTKEFAKTFNTKEFEAYRLLHTEGSFIIEQGTLKAYEEDELEQYEILATLDLKTSDICQEQDGKKYLVSKAMTGVNYPPFHPFCRTDTIPYYDDVDLSDDTRVARDEAGKNYKVPADMNYKDWHKEYIESNPKAVLVEQKWKNRFSDEKQFNNYENILKSDAPKSLDDFQNLKYNDIEKWENKKREYSTISKIKEKESYSEEYRSKLIKTYYEFKAEGYEFTDHSLNRFLGQKSSKGKVSFGKDDIINILKKEANYFDGDDRIVKFYDSISIIQNKNTKEIVSIVAKNKPKEGWNTVDK